MQNYYAVVYNGKRIADELDSIDEAVAFADNWFEEENESNMQDRSDECEILGLLYNEETGEETVNTKQTHTLFYEYYHGDLEEHGTYWKGCAI